jgi:hypothetical protein
MLLGAPAAASLEVVNDASGFIANFWRAVKHQPAAVAEWADYPVSHIDLGARHGWLMEQRASIGAAMHDPNWPGDAKVAGWWLWGQCCWIGSGWCDWNKGAGTARRERREGCAGSGEGIDATSAGMGVQAAGQVPHASDAGRGIWTSSGHTAWRWLHKLAARLERVRVVHGDWNRCLNSHYGGSDTAVFLDPPYRAFEKLYGVATPVADAVAEWARSNADLRIALCGHAGDYDLPGLGCRCMVARQAHLCGRQDNRRGVHLVFASVHRAAGSATRPFFRRACRMTKPWTDDEVAALVRALREGATYSECGTMFGRTIGAIAGCIRRYKEGQLAPVALPDDPASVPAGVSLLGLRPGMCKWPIAEAPEITGGFAFCAMPVGHQGAVYCAHHRRMATTARAEERRAA